MFQSFIVSDLDQCRELWTGLLPQEFLTDLWEVRACFQRHFQRPPAFVVCRDGGQVKGLLPLSWLEESGGYGFFPGETWQGKTWLEQNRILAQGEGTLEALLSSCPSPFHLRYLSDWGLPLAETAPVDEIGYLFHPPRYGYDLENYFQEFSGKSRKQILREVGRLEERGLELRYDHAPDFDLMVSLNRDRFGGHSYFADPRFIAGFRELFNLLRERGWLRLTTVILGGRPAAVDMGAVYQGVYTLLAGGTDPETPGVAKLINLQHMRLACRERLREVDFLCGDFTWKKMFHLFPRPLYLLSDQATRNLEAPAAAAGQGA
ncbi:MAG: GNAT family N-acetyltransferase [Desulfarculus sp.]|jgi:hypothetical protein|nr:MAG: GNAT family N-acetyltransferase [Desulfarculus sp.]